MIIDKENLHGMKRFIHYQIKNYKNVLFLRHQILVTSALSIFNLILCQHLILYEIVMYINTQK